jgi:hypothetical protein
MAWPLFTEPFPPTNFPSRAKPTPADDVFLREDGAPSSSRQSVELADILADGYVTLEGTCVEWPSRGKRETGRSNKTARPNDVYRTQSAAREQ